MPLAVATEYKNPSLLLQLNSIQMGTVPIDLPVPQWWAHRLFPHQQYSDEQFRNIHIFWV